MISILTCMVLFCSHHGVKLPSYPTNFPDKVSFVVLSICIVVRLIYHFISLNRKDRVSLLAVLNPQHSAQQ